MQAKRHTQYTVGITRSEYRARREAIYQQMPLMSIAILYAAKPRIRSGDVEYPFRQHSDFYYLTGYAESSATLVLTKNKEGVSRCILFIKLAQPKDIIWTGPRMGLSEAIECLGVDEAYELSEQEKRIEALLGQAQKVDMTDTIHRLRLKKSPAECALMRKAALISAEAHMRVIKACKPGLMEYALEAEFIHEVMQRGCRALAYPSIVGGGVEACTLHYIKNDQPLREGDLVLVDAGGEYQHYASDITRTFPVNGRFTENQKKLYNLVLKAQCAAIAAVAPGIPWDTLQKRILEILVPGLVDLGILEGNPEQLIQEKAYHVVYMHSSGHWLGLDVHDVGGYVVNEAPRILEPGMVLTVEPGIYIPDDPKIDKRWWGIGIRIEDDVLVTENGYEVLSKAAPKTVEAIEALMAVPNAPMH